MFSILDTLCTDWKNQWLFTKTANVYAITGILHHSTLDIPWRTEGWLKMLGSGIVLMMTPKSNLSRHTSKCEGPTGMHQSAEPIKDSFHWSSTPLLTLCLVVRAGRSLACQLLTVWLKWMTPSCLLSTLKMTLRLCNVFQSELMYVHVTGRTEEVCPFLLNCIHELWERSTELMQTSF